MRIRCESCGKRYDTDEDEMCPHCGAYNSPNGVCLHQREYTMRENGEDVPNRNHPLRDVFTKGVHLGQKDDDDTSWDDLQARSDRRQKKRHPALRIILTIVLTVVVLNVVGMVFGILAALSDEIFAPTPEPVYPEEVYTEWLPEPEQLEENYYDYGGEDATQSVNGYDITLLRCGRMTSEEYPEEDYLYFTFQYELTDLSKAKEADFFSPYLINPVSDEWFFLQFWDGANWTDDVMRFPIDTVYDGENSVEGTLFFQVPSEYEEFVLTFDDYIGDSAISWYLSL